MSSLVPLLILAHGAYPLAYQVEETPGAPTHLAAGTTFGLLLSDDDGATWSWVCEEAIGYGTSLNPRWWVSPGTLLAASFKGLFRSTDHGCTWSSHPAFATLPDGGQGTGATDVYGTSAMLFAVSGKYGVVNRVWRSTNEGVDWAELPIASDFEFYTTVRTAPSRPQRVYVAAWWFRPSPTEALYVSDDTGATFSRVDVSAKMPTVPIGDDGGMGVARGSFYVYAVDPMSPDTLYAGLQQDDDPRHSFVVKSIDQGQSWQQLLDTPDQLVGVSVSPDGATLWAATAGKLYRSTNGQPFAPLDVPTRNSCVGNFGQRLYTCGWPEVDMFAVGRSEDQGEGFTPALTWPRLQGVASCPADSKVTTQCAGFFPALVAMFPSADGGTGGGAGGGSGGSGGGGQTPASCHCSAGGAELSLTLWLVLGRLARVHALRRRRVHR